MTWKHVSTETIQKNKISTFSKDVQGGSLFYTVFTSGDQCQTNLQFVPNLDVAFIANKINEVKNALKSLKNRDYHLGEYDEDILPRDIKASDKWPPDGF